MSSFPRKYINSSINEIEDIILTKGWYIEKYHALYEYAFRALEEKKNLKKAWDYISSEINTVSRKGPPFGVPAAYLLYESDDEDVIKALAESISDWGQIQQEDFFFNVIPQEDRVDFHKKLSTLVTTPLKVIIFPDGDVQLSEVQ